MSQNLIPSPRLHASAEDVLISKDQAQETSYQQDELRLFVFEFAKMTFSLLLKYVEEVIESDKIETYPGSVTHCRGTINHRGRVVPIFDSHGLGFEKDQEEARSPYIVIINVDGLVFGLTLEKHLELIYCDTRLIEQSAQDCHLYTLGMVPYREKAMTVLAPELIAPLVRLRFNNQRIEDYKASDQLNESAESLGKFIVSQIGEMTIAHPVETVLEIVEGLDVMPLFGADSSLRGLTSLRGRVLACIDISEILGLAPRVLDDRSAFLVLSTKEAEFALCVDQVLGIKNLALDNFQPTEGLLPLAIQQLFDGVAEKGAENYLRLMASAIVDWDRLAPFRNLAAE
jgi:chemotaxis signal transduction protein